MKHLLLLSTALMIPAGVVQAASELSSNTHTNTPIELKSISQNNGIKLASICFLGSGGCGDAGFSSGDGDYKVDTEQQCKNEGFVKLNCSALQEIEDACPYNSAYGKKCKCSSTLTGCSSPLLGVGESCGGKYARCTCPAGVSAGTYGCKEYYGSPCNSVCKTAYADNCHNRNSVSVPYGCAEYWPDCASKCKTAYNDNCRNRIEVSHPYGCESYYADCQAKCEIAKSKPRCQIGSIYYSDRSCSTADAYDRSKKALGVVVYMTPDGNHGQVMSDKLGNEWFSGRTAYNIPNLPDYNSKQAAIQDFKSCANTDIIVNAVGEYFAAGRVRNYAPTPETKGKWCLPAAGVLNSYHQNRSIINGALRTIGASRIFSSDICLWSSTEDDATHMWMWCNPPQEIRNNNNNITGDNADPNDKDDDNSYVGVLEF